jgi:hypothetical protein
MKETTTGGVAVFQSSPLVLRLCDIEVESFVEESWVGTLSVGDRATTAGMASVSLAGLPAGDSYFAEMDINCEGITGIPNNVRERLRNLHDYVSPPVGGIATPISGPPNCWTNGPPWDPDSGTGGTGSNTASSSPAGAMAADSVQAVIDPWGWGEAWAMVLSDYFGVSADTTVTASYEVEGSVSAGWGGSSTSGLGSASAGATGLIFGWDGSDWNFAGGASLGYAIAPWDGGTTSSPITPGFHSSELQYLRTF